MGLLFAISVSFGFGFGCWGVDCWNWLCLCVWFRALCIVWVVNSVACFVLLCCIGFGLRFGICWYDRLLIVVVGLVVIVG